jgi:UDP-3-O-[3-hydroxymyristoyl] glucosamine N-acyltransferase
MAIQADPVAPEQHDPGRSSAFDFPTGSCLEPSKERDRDGMDQHSFFARSERLTLADVAAASGADLVDSSLGGRSISGLAVLTEAGPEHLTFLESQKYLPQLEGCRAGACLVQQRFEGRVPDGVAVLRSKTPYRAFVTIARRMHADALRPARVFDGPEIAQGAIVHPTARLEDGVVVDPLAVIGAGAQVGQDTVIGPGAVIGPGVTIGRSCNIGAQATVICSLIGNNVIIHSGCRIGQDGYGFVPTPKGHVKVPQTGRVIIQNDVEIGANSTIDRGALRDTVIGEGTKIDNLVQIGHNVTIGRHCIIVSQVGISGSATIGDGVALGARAGVRDHITVGDGAQIAALGIALRDIPPGGQCAGMPAKPAKLWLRELVVVEQLARNSSAQKHESNDGSDRQD